MPTVGPGAHVGEAAGVGSVCAELGRPGQQLVVVVAECVLAGYVGVARMEDTDAAAADGAGAVAGAEAGDGAVGY